MVVFDVVFEPSSPVFPKIEDTKEPEANWRLPPLFCYLKRYLTGPRQSTLPVVM